MHDEIQYFMDGWRNEAWSDAMTATFSVPHLALAIFKCCVMLVSKFFLSSYYQITYWLYKEGGWLSLIKRYRRVGWKVTCSNDNKFKNFLKKYPPSLLKEWKRKTGFLCNPHSLRHFQLYRAFIIFSSSPFLLLGKRQGKSNMSG